KSRRGNLVGQAPVGKGRTGRATGEANNGADARDDRRARREAAVLDPGASPNGAEGAVATAELPGGAVAEPAIGPDERARGTRISLEVTLYALLGLLALLTRFFD